MYIQGVSQNAAAELAGIWDHDAARARACANSHGLKACDTLEALLDISDAVIVCSENKLHAKHIAAALNPGKKVLCEKPLVTNEEEANLIKSAAGPGAFVMTALPCRYSPAFLRLKERVKAGDIGPIKAICATNRGQNPGGWFCVPELSGGGALADHSVHVADLLWVLLGEEPSNVDAKVGHNITSSEGEDCAMLTLDYPSGTFVTIDASWSRPKHYKTWGDLMLTVVGEQGVIDVDMFAQDLQIYGGGEPSHRVAGFGSDVYGLMLQDFIRCASEDRPSPIPLEDGLRNARVVIEAYKSLVVPA